MSVIATIVQGEDREISFGLKDVDQDVYIDLTGATAIVLKIAATAGSSTDFTLAAAEIVVTDATKGKFKAIMSDTKTALIKLGDRDIEVQIDWGTNRRIVQSTKAVTVVKRLF